MKLKLFVLLPFVLFISFVSSQTKFTRNQLISDYTYYWKTIKEVHINPFYFIDSTEYYRKRDSLISALPDSVSLKESTLFFHKISALLEDGHSSCSVFQPEMKPIFSKKIFFPFKIVIKSGKIYLGKTENHSIEIPVGAEITSINGKSIHQILKNCPRLQGGNPAFTNEMLQRLFSYILFLHEIEPPFKIEYQINDKDKKTFITNEACSYSEILIANMPHLKEKYAFKILDSKAGLLTFSSMNGDLKAFKNYLDSCVTLMKNEKINHFVIDIRNNSGGNSMFADVLISYFYNKKYTLMGKRKWKISDQYKQYLRKNGENNKTYLSKKTGDIIERGNCKSYSPPYKSKNIFTGNVYLLTGPFTFSSANMLADGFKYFHMGTIAGEATGENVNDFGELYTFFLPVTKLQMSTTTSFDFGVGCPENGNHPVEPDIQITPSLKARCENIDEVLTLLMDQLKNK